MVKQVRNSNLSYSMYLDTLHFNQNNNRGCHFESSYVFAMLEVGVHSYLSYSQSLESTKNFSLQYSLRYFRTLERVVTTLNTLCLVYMLCMSHTNYFTMFSKRLWFYKTNIICRSFLSFQAVVVVSKTLKYMQKNITFLSNS